MYRSCQKSHRVQIMRHHAPLSPLLAVAASLVFAATVAAGGWAVATLDAKVATPTAGQSFDVRFKLMQHGVTPVSSGTVVVRATAPDGRELSFAARRTAAPGHWTAAVSLPSSGAWQWRIEMPNGLQVTSAEFGSWAVGGSAGAAPGTPLLPVSLAIAVVLLALLLWRGRPVRHAPRAISGEPQRP